MAVTAPQSYRDELFGANPSRMVVMLYDEILEALDLAVDCIEKDDITGRCNAVTIAIELITTLYLTLDMKNGGKVAENLGNIYGYLLKSLPQVNIANDPATAQQAIALLKPLRQSWSTLDDELSAAAQDGILGAFSARKQAAENARDVA